MHRQQVVRRQQQLPSNSSSESSNRSSQHRDFTIFTFTPQNVEINVGESVTWFSPAELVDIHTVTFVRDPSIQSDIILPFAVPADGNFELLEPFIVGTPLLIQAPDGGDAIAGLNKDAWYPTVMDANNQTTYLNGTDIQYTI